MNNRNNKKNFQEIINDIKEKFSQEGIMTWLHDDIYNKFQRKYQATFKNSMLGSKNKINTHSKLSLLKQKANKNLTFLHLHMPKCVGSSLLN